MQKMSLKALRINAGYSQKGAAKLLGVSNKTLWMWENGKAFPKQPKIEAMSALYGVPYDVMDFSRE